MHFFLKPFFAAALFPIILFTAFFNSAQPEKENLAVAFDTAANLPYLNPPFVSAVINDTTDPAAVNGISITILENGIAVQPSAYTLSAESSNASVAGSNGLHFEKQTGSAKLFIKPESAGYSTITISIKTKKNEASLVVNYAASAAPTQQNSYWHTGNSDASAAIALDDKYMVVADDEMNHLCVYNRLHSGLPLVSFSYNDKLNFTDGTAPYFNEADVEAGTRSPSLKDRTYWLASMSNSSSFKLKPNRNRLFAVDINGTGKNTVFSFVGYYDRLRENLIKWGDEYNYNFSKNAKEGRNAKAINGFNAEAMAFSPDNTTLYIGFRAPLVPPGNRMKAVIAPVTGFEAWFNNGHPDKNPAFGKPIELDLAGRGIRDMIRLSNGMYIIIAGSYDETANAAIYSWSGQATDNPVLFKDSDITAFNAEAVVEIDNAGNRLNENELQLISDNGNTVYYNDGKAAKQLSQNNFKKFNSVVVPVTGLSPGKPVK